MEKRSVVSDGVALVISSRPRVGRTFVCVKTLVFISTFNRMVASSALFKNEDMCDEYVEEYTNNGFLAKGPGTL